MIVGDLIDEYTNKDDFDKFCKALNNLNCTNNKFFIPGNHEYLHSNLNLDYVTSKLFESDFKYIDDNLENVNNDLCIIGHNDISLENGKSLKDIMENNILDKFIILAEHQPFNFDKKSELGIDLQISGHTHAGQIFPAGLFISLAMKYCYGHFLLDNSNFIISSGLSGWGILFCTEKNCEYVLVNLHSL